MAICSYNAKRIIPAPFVQITKSFNKTGDGENVGAVFTLVLTGTLMSFKGSPDDDGLFYTGSRYDPDGRTDPTFTVGIDQDSRIASIFRKQEALRELFSEEGHSLEFQAFDGSPPIKCNPRIQSIEFQDGTWVDVCRYTITCEADIVYVNGQSFGEDTFESYISDLTETWNIDVSDDRGEGLGLPRTYTLTHAISARGKRFYNEIEELEAPAWEQARRYVLPRLGIANALLPSSGVLDLPSYYAGFNHVRKEDIDKRGGNYGITETWLLASGSALEDFNVSVKRDARDGLTNVSIEGTITGLEERDTSLQLVTSKYDNASDKFTSVSGVLLTRAQAYSGMTLNVEPMSTVIGRNPVTGSITYAFEYNDRPSNFIAGAKSETISVSNSFNVDTFAQIFVLGRVQGPVLQNLGTKEATTSSLNIEVVFSPATLSANTAAAYRSMIWSQNPRFSGAAPDIQKIIDGFSPLNAGLAATQFTSEQTENWEPTSGRYTYRLSVTYE